jgi:2-keto-4-pentenoate hydratase/2-oxohepta-3-ene-1,7-dioic acid hydratase in catechol pathway
MDPASLDGTHDPDARSWVPSANVFRADFPLQNLPLGVFTGPRSPEPAIGVAIGDQVLAPARLSSGRFDGMYWSFAQMIAHYTSGGCNLRRGDLVASGTVSGSDRASRECLLELSWRGSEPIALPGGEVWRFLEDGDEVVMRGRAVAPGHCGVGLGECRGRMSAARAPGS